MAIMIANATIRPNDASTDARTVRERQDVFGLKAILMVMAKHAGKNSEKVCSDMGHLRANESRLLS